MAAKSSSIRIERLTGPELEQRISALADLRIRVFREWPYLYEGDLAHEQDYLATYIDNPDAVLIAAWDGDQAVGASTALPLLGEPDSVIEPFRRLGFAPETIFYFGESVLLPQYRRRGIGVAFFIEREAHARRFERFSHAAFCGVVRAQADPRKPTDYVPLDAFWGRRGYAKALGLECAFSWREIGQKEETAKTMQFWMKDLRA